MKLTNEPHLCNRIWVGLGRGGFLTVMGDEMGEMYIVCCGINGRAVLIGESESEPVAGQPITMANVRMVLYWDSACGGLLGLAANGPKGSTRITAAVEKHGDECVKQWVKVSETARKGIESWPIC